MQHKDIGVHYVIMDQWWYSVHWKSKILSPQGTVVFYQCNILMIAAHVVQNAVYTCHNPSSNVINLFIQ